VRAFLPDPLPLKKLSALLWACQGVTAKSGRYLFKTAPSAGAAYPYETYVFAHRVEGLAPGFYHFDPAEFCLTLVREADLSRDLAAACLDQRFTAEAPAVVAWSAIPARSAWKYGDRAARYVGLDLGHVCENLFLGAVALGLGACAVGAFLDADLNRLMELDGEEEFAFYLAAVGAPRD
jgi:SagB-type dehydrogenase family enzyme